MLRLDLLDSGCLFVGFMVTGLLGDLGLLGVLYIGC